MADQQYWAARPTDEIGERLKARVDDYLNDRLVSGQSERGHRAYLNYFGMDPSGVHATSQILRGGEAGELAEVRVNHSRSLVNTLLNLIVAPKLVWQPKAVNIDYDSVRECNLAAAILEYYWSEKQVAKFAVAALEEAIVFTEAFVLLEWDGEAGDDYAVLDDASVKSGDVRFTNVSTWDVIRDPNKNSFDALDWVIVRLYRNRYDLMAQHPDRAEDIAAIPEDVKVDQANPGARQGEVDDIPCYYFFHKRTPALPKGRETLFLSADVVLRDTDLSYDGIPLYRVSAGETTGTPFGYSPYMDILGVQELMDSLHTSVASNQTTLATQCIVVEEGTDIAPEHIAGGMKVIYVPAGSTTRPEALQLLQTPAEVFNHLQSLQKQQELLFGLNSVVRGEPQSGELSGSALALLQSQALQQSSTLQANYLRFVEGMGTCLVSIIQQRATVPKKVAIVGKGNQFLVTDAEYTGESISRIKKIQVEIGNPLAQTSAGRIEMAKELMNLGLIKSPEQYMQVLQTGRVEPLTQSLSNELLLIKSENEQMSRAEFDESAPPPPPQFGPDGRPLPPEQQLTPESMPPVLVLDDHMLHAREHRAVLANPEARRNPAVIRAVLQHIDEHEQMYYSAPPQTLLMVGQMPPPMMAGPAGPLGPPPGDPGASPPGGSQPGDSGPPQAAPPGMAPGGPAPKPPQPPKNPATGARWNATDGGGAVPR